MSFLAFVVTLLVGILVGSAAGLWLAAQARAAVAASSRQAADREQYHVDRFARLVEREAQLRERLARAEAAVADGDRLVDAFRSASSDAFAATGDHLVQLAEAKYGALSQSTDAVLAGHGRAVDEGLRALGDRLAALERERSESAGALRAVVAELATANQAAQRETAKLTAAMRDHRVRGAWGEVQLRRTLELAGLTRHVDFVEQLSVGGQESRGRPDVVVHLPEGRCAVIDAKVPLDRFLDAANAGDPDIERRLQSEHAKAVAGHVQALANRDYTGKVDGSVDMVLMFLPGDPFLAAALDADPSLFESAAAKGVHLVTPTSLVPVLRGIALGWREHRAEAAAAEIQRVGTELHERLAVFAEHFAAVGANLDRTVAAFNRSVGSFDARVAPATRRLDELGAGSRRVVPEVVDVSTLARPLRALELVVTAEAEVEVESAPAQAAQ